MRSRTTLLVGSVIASFAALEGCTSATDTSRIAQFESQGQQESLTLTQRRLVEQHCYEGHPRRDPHWVHGDTIIIARDGYVLEHANFDRIPIWVCEKVESSQLIGDGDRDDSDWASDPVLVANDLPRATDSDYTHSGFNRGHMAMAANHKVSQERMDDTFYFSNAVPQDPNNNQRIWQSLEFSVHDWVESRGEAYVISGPMFYEAEEDGPGGDGEIEYQVIGANKVAVPTHVYKIVVCDDAGGTPQAIAFVFENRHYPKVGDAYPLDEQIVSIDWIEERTGLDFMPDLRPSEESRLESSAPISIWAETGP